MSQGAQAHTDRDKARFVAEDGVDAGKCDNRFRPCKKRMPMRVPIA
ncbi:hypothetical protein [Alteromonas macleodii]|nr:hypothetical protein [Alteromonas macleodii]